MSFVLSVCGSDFSVMMSDGRVQKYALNQEVHEDYPKVFQISEKVCLGVQGDPVASYYILKELQQYEVSKITLERMKRILTNALKEVPVNMQGVRFVIAGRNKLNKFMCYCVDSKKDFEEIKYDPLAEERPVVVVFGADSENVKKVIEKHMYDTMPWTDVEELKIHMRDCIREAASVDDNINDNIYEMVVL